MLGDRAVAWLALVVVWLVCAGLPPVAGAGVPSWHTERQLAQAVGSDARVAITSAGDVGIAWQDAGKGLRVAVRPAGGRFGAPPRLSRSGVTSLVRSMPAGAGSLSIGGRAGDLRAGRYRARISARDCGGRRSKSQAVPFVVSRPGFE